MARPNEVLGTKTLDESTRGNPQRDKTNHMPRPKKLKDGIITAFRCPELLLLEAKFHAKNKQQDYSTWARSAYTGQCQRDTKLPPPKGHKTSRVESASSNRNPRPSSVQSSGNTTDKRKPLQSSFRKNPKHPRPELTSLLISTPKKGIKLMPSLKQRVKATKKGKKK